MASGVDVDGASGKGDVVSVLFVEKRHAKSVKTTLESTQELNKDFRMVPADRDWQGTIAVPVRNIKEEHLTMNGIRGRGTFFCPFSSSLLGNHVGRSARTASRDGEEPWTLIEQALLANSKRHGLPKGPHQYDGKDDSIFLERIRRLDLHICPKKLEYLGDDHTLVLQRRVFSLEEASFVAFLGSMGCHERDCQEAFVSTLWEELASAHKSPRVARRGEIAPSSGIRESNYRLLWPFCGVPENTGTCLELSVALESLNNLSNMFVYKGPGSPAWITVTEQGIRQSFDMTRVMFSRGNITEKIRFGKLVQRGDIVLDLYGACCQRVIFRINPSVDSQPLTIIVPIARRNWLLHSAGSGTRAGGLRLCL